MIEMQPAVLLLLIEAVALLTVAQLVWVVLAWLRRRKVNAAVAALIETVGADADARAERNGGAIGGALGAEGETLDTHVKAVERATKIVLQRVVVGWSRSDASSLEALPEALEGLSTQWRELLAAGGQATASAAPVDDTIADAYEAKITKLTEEKQALEEEISITRNTMDSMLNEYAAMYDRGGKNSESTAKAMLSGEQNDVAAAATPEPDGGATGGAATTAAAPQSAAASVAVAAVTASEAVAAVAASEDVADAAVSEDDDNVTEDDLDALFDAHAVAPAATAADDDDDDLLLAELDAEDAFDGLDDTPPPADVPAEAAGKTPAVTAAG